MKGLNTLIKLHKRTLDDLRRKMAGLENQKSQLQLLSAKLRKELEQEIALAATQPEMAHFFGDFAKRIRQRQDDIAAEIQVLDQKIATLSDQITQEFAELKKFEIARDNAKRRADEEEKRKEMMLMDEIAGQRHDRKQEGS